MARPPYTLTEGEVWLVAGEDRRYHVTPCPVVVEAHDARALHVAEVTGPETTAARTMCTQCAQALGHDAWPPQPTP